MFDRKEFIRAFSELGDCLKCSSGRSFFESMKKTEDCNPFFTRYMQDFALKAIAENYLSEEALEKLLGYSDGPADDQDRFRKLISGKTVGIIMAGNIPAVGFHDLLCALSVGADVVARTSSKDPFLVPAMVNLLREISPETASGISFWEKPHLSEYDGKLDFLLFAGADSTKALLSGEFPGISMLARGSRFSLGVLSGEETDEQLELLARDMFLYCGMGCRSISYLFVPQRFDLQRIINASSRMRDYVQVINPYMSIFARLRAIAQIEGRMAHSECLEADRLRNGDFIDGGFFLLEKSDQPFPPVGSVRYAVYRDISQVDEFCSLYSSQIQKKYTTFGIAQTPGTDDWMDGVNTVTTILKKLLP